MGARTRFLAAVLAALLMTGAVIGAASAQTAENYTAMSITGGTAVAVQNVAKQGDILILSEYLLTDDPSHPHGPSGALMVLKDGDDIITRGRLPSAGRAVLGVYEAAGVGEIPWAGADVRLCVQVNPTSTAANSESCSPITWRATDDTDASVTVLNATVVALLQGLEQRAGATGTYLTQDAGTFVLTEQGGTLLRQAWGPILEFLPGLAATQLYETLSFEQVSASTPENPAVFETSRVPSSVFADGFVDLGGVFGLPEGGSIFLGVVLIFSLVFATGYFFGGASGAEAVLLLAGPVALFTFYAGLIDLYMAIAPVALMFFVGTLILWRKHVPGATSTAGILGWVALVSVGFAFLDVFLTSQFEDTPIRTLMTMDVYRGTGGGFGGTIGFLVPLLNMFRVLWGLATFDYSFFAGPFAIVRVFLAIPTTILVGYGIFQALGPVLNGIGSLFRRIAPI